MVRDGARESTADRTSGRQLSVDSKWEDEDRNLLLSSLDELDDYLSSSVLLWPLKNSRLPLSPGNLLLARKRLQFDTDVNIVQALKRTAESMHVRRSAWTSKSEAEFPMRLQQWKAFLEDIKDFGRIDHSYSYNVRVRVIIDLLVNEYPHLIGKSEFDLRQLDKFFTERTVPGRFVWNERYESVFPLAKYAYLYVNLKGEAK